MPIIDASIQTESQDRYLTYALSVVSGRALPDVRDGLKPVQRRILFAMFRNLNLKPSGTHRKSATVVGEVIGHFHPHGETACYEAMVRMAQDFTLRYPLVDGQGNFGSLDGDSAAAYRYTEAKLRAFALEVIGEIDEETVDFRDNFDATKKEPVVFPSRVPHLLLNGASGIAVGMATNIPPHNLRELVKAILELNRDPELSDAKLVSIVRGPDFPTGCLILNSKREIEEIYRTGRGGVRMRGEWQVEEGARGKRSIVVTTIPFGVNKAQLVEKIANLIIEKKVPQLVDVRDESTDEIRVVLELASDAKAEVAMAYLFKYTPLEEVFQVNLTALVPTDSGACVPKLLSLRECLLEFLKFRVQVVRRRLEFEKRQLLDRIHILEGLVAIYDDLDTALKIVRKSDGRSDAAGKLRERFSLTEIQAFAVVDMRIYQLSRTNIEEIRAELKTHLARVHEIDGILGSKKKISALVEKELEAIVESYGDKRRSKLSSEGEAIEFREEDYVVDEDIFAIVTSDGWIKRIRQTNEVESTRIREGDRILNAHPISTKEWIVMVTNRGSLFSLRGADFPSSSGYGEPIQKLLKFKDEERVVASFAVRASASEGKNDGILEGDLFVLITGQGAAFVTPLKDFTGLTRSGRRIMKVRDDDALAVALPLGEVVLACTRKGMAVAVETRELPVKESPVMGVSLIDVKEGDSVVSAVCRAKKDRAASFTIEFESGSKKELGASEVPVSHRALKGKRIISSGEVRSVRRS